MDMLTKEVQKPMPSCMLSADDIFLIKESRESVNSQLELQRQTFQTNSFT